MVRICAMLAAMAVLVGILLGPGVAQAQTVSFSTITVEGNQRIESATIRSFAGIEPGTPQTAQSLNDALQRLFETGLFEDVTVTPAGRTLQIVVVENPTINIINFEGNRRIDDDLLRTFISLAPRQAFSRAAAEEDARAIVEAYARQGRFGATVTPQIIRLEDNRVNLVFAIFEGRVTEVQQIAFAGNKIYSDYRLRRVIETGQAGLFSVLFTNDTYDQDRVEQDKQALRNFYLNRGYIDFEVLSAAAELSRERNAFFLTFRLSEGPQYTIGETRVTSFAEGIDPFEYEELLNLRRGEVYSIDRVDADIERLAFEAGQRGFAFIDIAPRVIRNPDDLTVDIEFELIESPRVFIERIDIRGNTETVDRVIRRQFRVVEGDAFNAREIRRAEDRIRALGYFSAVEVRIREGSASDRAVVTVDVEEAPTGSLNFGAAFSSAEGVTGTISLSERNFLGRGQQVSIDFASGADSNTLAFNFEEPALFDQDLSASFSIFYREFQFDESSINTTTLGFRPQIGFPLTENARFRVGLNLQQQKILDSGVGAVSPIITRENGTELTTGVTFGYTLDRRNSPVDPSAGFLFTLDQEFAGLAGDNEFSKTSALAQAYTSLLEEDVILSAALEGGVLIPFDGQTRFTNRFNLGGDSFRGFERGGLGPRDRCDACGGTNGDEDVNDALGGNMFAVARAEASFPIGIPEEYGIFGGVFADAGSVWGLRDTAGASGTVDDRFRLRSSVGFSLFWDTTIGPLRFNFARPVRSVEGDQFERFRITIDTRF